MSIVLQRPYQFIPPHRGNFWPTLIQKFRVVDHYLRFKEGVRSFECRNLELFERALCDDRGILLTPNHCRYADPLVMGWPARLASAHVYAMASWHLFNKSWLDRFAMRKMGAFSINRESADRQSLETAIDILSSGERPLILFPEGTTSRMNDDVKELLDGVTFIARSAARRSVKNQGKAIVMLPVAIKYLCREDCKDWVIEHSIALENHLGQTKSSNESLPNRVIHLVEMWLALQERLVFGKSQVGPVGERRAKLVDELLLRLEDQLSIKNEVADQKVSSRIRVIRSEIVNRRFSDPSTNVESLRAMSESAMLCQELATYDDRYLTSDQVSDIRLVETIQRLQESCFGKAKQNFPLHAVIDFGEPIDVPASKAPRGKQDPLLGVLETTLKSMIQNLSSEAKLVSA